MILSLICHFIFNLFRSTFHSFHVSCIFPGFLFREAIFSCRHVFSCLTLLGSSSYNKAVALNRLGMLNNPPTPPYIIITLNSSQGPMPPFWYWRIFIWMDRTDSMAYIPSNRPWLFTVLSTHHWPVVSSRISAHSLHSSTFTNSTEYEAMSILIQWVVPP